MAGRYRSGRSSRPRVGSTWRTDPENLAAVLAWAARAFRLPLRRTGVRWDAAVFTRRHALRRTGPRPPFRALRTQPALPVRSSARFRGEPVASDVASQRIHDRSDASLEVFVPFSACRSRCVVPGDAIAPAIPLRPLACVAASFALMLLEHAAPTHRRRLLVLAVFRSGGVGAIDSARIEPRVLIGTLRRSTRRCIVPRRPPTGHAPATFCGRRSATRWARITWPGRAPFGVEACVVSVP